MLRILTVFGTRPEAIKLACLIDRLRRDGTTVSNVVCFTGQHREMVAPVLSLFGILPDVNMDVMRPAQTIDALSARMLEEFPRVIAQARPDYVVVQGDTTTAMAAALSAYYSRVAVAHVEAGLRTFRKYEPFPEEINRKVIDTVSDVCFAHSGLARTNLLAEGVPDERIVIAGNTVIDAVLEVASMRRPTPDPTVGRLLADPTPLVLFTAHRRESFGEPMVRIFESLARIAQRFAGRLNVLYPVHLNPQVHDLAWGAFRDVENVTLVQPLDYVSLVNVLQQCRFVMTDSGGLQEEASAFGKPLLILRDTTERPEVVHCGLGVLVGSDPAMIEREAERLLTDEGEYARRSRVSRPFGEGNASEIIADYFHRAAK